MELLVKVGTSGLDPAYQDGDIVDAFSNERIATVHASHICDAAKFGFTDDGLRVADPLLIGWQSKRHRYICQRVGDTVERLDRETNQVDILGKTPNAKGEYIDAALYLARRLKNPRHMIFGGPGSEYWFSLQIQYDINDIWAVIESHSDYRREDFNQWPLTETEKRHFLAVSCCGHRHGENVEISNPTVISRTHSIYGDDSPEAQIVAKRLWRVPYWDIANELGLNVDDIRNQAKELDPRTTGNERRHLDDTNQNKIDAGLVVI